MKTKITFCFWGDIASGLEGNPKGGAERQLSLIVKYLTKFDTEIIVVDTQADGHSIIDGVNIISLKRSGKTLYKCLKDIKADVYYARMRTFRHYFVFLAARNNNTKFIYHVASDLDTLNGINIIIDRLKTILARPDKIRGLGRFILTELLFPNILKKADMIITQHSGQTINLKKKGITNIIEIRNLYEHKECSDEIPAAVQDIGKEYIAVIGGIARYKGIIELEKIISKVQNRKFLIIGGARDKNGELFINKLKLYPNVIYMKHIPHCYVLYYLKNAELLLSTSLVEGFSNAFIEAWGLGVPVFSLHVDPGGIINSLGLGRCYNGNLEQIVNDLKKEIPKVNGQKLISYVNEFHDPKNNAELIYNKFQLLNSNG